MTTSSSLLPFSSAATQSSISTCMTPFPHAYIIEHMLTLSSYLLSLAENSTLFGTPSHDPFVPSLRTLHDRLQNGYLAPPPLPAQFITDEQIKACTIPGKVKTHAPQRPLAHFEDIYYALLARLQELSNLLHLRIGSAFNTTSDAVFSDGPSIATLHDDLVEYWSVLSDAACGRALDDAVRRARVECLHGEIVRQVQMGEVSGEDGEAQIAQLWSAEVYSSVDGLEWTVEWAPVLVGALLEEKYRAVLGLEKKERGKIERKRKRLERRKKGAAKNEKMDVERNDKRAAISVDEAAQQPPVTQLDLDQGPAQQDLELHHAHQDQLQHDVNWQSKTQRVSAYSQYLRDRASQHAQHIVDKTLTSGSVGTLTDPALEHDEVDADMEF